MSKTERDYEKQEIDIQSIPLLSFRTKLPYCQLKLQYYHQILHTSYLTWYESQLYQKVLFANRAITLIKYNKLRLCLCVLYMCSATFIYLNRNINRKKREYNHKPRSPRKAKKTTSQEGKQSCTEVHKKLWKYSYTLNSPENSSYPL